MISLHYPDGTIVSPKLRLSQERFDWLSLHMQYHLHAPPPCPPPYSRRYALYYSDITHLLRPINYRDNT